MSLIGCASIAIVILAGGQGRRLGGIDKGLHSLHRFPLIAHVVAAIDTMFSPDDVFDGHDVLTIAKPGVDTYSSFAWALPDAVGSGEGPMAGIVTAFLEARVP